MYMRIHLFIQGTPDFPKMEELFFEASNFLEECFDSYSDASIQLDKNFAYFSYTKLQKVEKVCSRINLAYFN